MFRDQQSSIRKEISRLLEIKGKTIAFVKRWSFCTMIRHHLSQVFVVTLLICLWLGSVVALPTDNLAGIVGPEPLGIEIENENRSEHADSDEGGLTGIHGGTSDDGAPATSRAANLKERDSRVN